MKIVSPKQEGRPGQGRAPVAPERIATVVGVTGLLFLLVGGGDVLLTWFPLDMGNREWEFGTITAAFNGLLTVTFGLLMTLLWASQGARTWPLRTLAVVFGLVGVLILLIGGLYWTTVPLALQAVEGSPVRVGIVKAVAKTGFQGVAFPVAYFFLAWQAWKWGGSSR